MKLGFQLLVHLKIVLILLITSSVHVSFEKETWAESLYNILKIRNDIADHMYTLKTDRFMEFQFYNHEEFLQSITALPKAIENFGLTSLDAVPVKKVENPIYERIAEALNEEKDINAQWLFEQKKLTDFITNIRGLFNLLKGSMKLFTLVSGNDAIRVSLGDTICLEVQEPSVQPAVTIKAICSSLHQCATESYPYGDTDYQDDAKNACTRDQKCIIEIALPMMGGLLWNSITNFIAQRLCKKKFSLSADDLNDALLKLQHETQLFMAYTHIMPPYFDSLFTKFMQNAVESQGLSKLNVALQLVKDKEAELRLMQVACEEIKFSDACFYGDIYTQYTIIEKARKHRSHPGLIKDLRLNSKLDKQTMITLQADSLKHLEILESIKKLDENLKASVKGISSYFTNLAKYDEEVAEQDIIFIAGELTKYENSLKNVEKSLEEKFKALGDLQLSVAITNLVVETVKLTARIIENCNPFRVIFGGSEPGDIVEQLRNVANAAAKVTKARALLNAVHNLYADSEEFNKAFFNGDKSNKNQIKDIKLLVDKIRKKEADDIGADGADFIKKYGAYSPQTDRSGISRNNALWSAFKDAMCDLFNEEAGAIPQLLTSAMLICERLDGALAQFFTLREDIFDFQFQMVDALARIVRANIAKRLAADIKGKGDVMDGRQLLLGSLMSHSRIQTHASLFCDILEYKNLGKPVAACSTVDGLFKKNNLESLIAYKDTSPPSLVERDVYIPTKPRFQGDTGYIDLSSLAENGHAVFKIPVDSSWLQHYRWILYGENIPFVEDFKIYLLHKEYKTGEEQQHTTTRVTITSVGANAVSTIAPNTSPVYVLPVDHSTYVTVYEEGYPSCKLNYRIPNPYGLCNNLPDICDKSSREAGESLLPTILSSWKLSFTIQQGGNKLKWKAPNPSTNLMFKATLKLRMWPAGKAGSSFRHLRMQKPKYKVSERNFCCDTGNKYRDLLGACKKCPDHSTSKLRGLYCEIDQGQSGNTG